LRQFALAQGFAGEKRSKSSDPHTARLLLNQLCMMDLVYVAATCAFFATALIYVWGCIRL